MNRFPLRAFCPAWGRATKIVLIAAVVLGGAMVSPGSAGPQVVDRIVAVVNDDIIRLRELEKQLAPVKENLSARDLAPEQMRQQLYDARMQLLNEMINETLADQQAAESGIQVEEAEVDAAIEQVKARNYYTDETLRQALHVQGLSMEEYRRELKRQMLRSRLVNRKVKSSIVITAEDIRRYYEAHPEKYGGETQYRLRNILLPWPEADKRAPQLRQRLQQIRQQALNGSSFAQLAKTHSKAPNAREGGALGKFAIDDLARELRPAISGLGQGEVSDVVETSQGLQLFFVEEILQTEPVTLESVAEEIEEQLYNQQVDEKYSTWLQSLREDAHIRILR